MIKLARASGVPVLIDPKGTDFERYRGATLLTPNLSEFEAVAGKCKTEDEIVERGMKIIADFDLSALLVTRSEQGMTLLQPGKAPLHMPTQAQEVYDVTGAGDTVIGVLAATLAAGNTTEEACYFANAAAGVVSGQTGYLYRFPYRAGKRRAWPCRYRFWRDERRRAESGRYRRA